MVSSVARNQEMHWFILEALIYRGLTHKTELQFKFWLDLLILYGHNLNLLSFFQSQWEWCHLAFSIFQILLSLLAKLGTDEYLFHGVEKTNLLTKVDMTLGLKESTLVKQKKLQLNKEPFIAISVSDLFDQGFD